MHIIGAGRYSIAPLRISSLPLKSVLSLSIYLSVFELLEEILDRGDRVDSPFRDVLQTALLDELDDHIEKGAGRILLLQDVGQLLLLRVEEPVLRLSCAKGRGGGVGVLERARDVSG